MEKAKHSLIRIERIDGSEHVGVTGDDPEELLAMLGDGLAHVLHEHPWHYRGARKLMRRILRDYRPESPLDYLTRNWHWNLLGAGALYAAIYGASCLCHLLGVV